MRYTLEDVVDFCWDHKRNKGFKSYAYEQIAQHIIWAADNKRLIIVSDEQGLCGVCTYTNYPDRLYVHHIVATRSGFATLVIEAGKQFPELPIQGLRRSKLVTFPITKLCQTIPQV
jgi:hypothetical protein